MVNNPNNIIKMNNPLSPQIVKNIKTDHSTWRWKSWWWRGQAQKCYGSNKIHDKT